MEITKKTAFKLALVAGHNLSTPKGCWAMFDPNETREWVLNARIADRLEELLSEYDGIEVLRIDDRNGISDMSLSEITSKANRWGADFYLSIHHNGGIMGGDGGGIVAIAYTNPQPESLLWQKELYDSAIKHTSLVGNRATPLARMNLHEVRETLMPAVLMECGFMDSSSDVPIILSEEFAFGMAEAFCEVIVRRSGARKKSKREESGNAQSVEVSTPTPTVTLTLPVLKRGSRGGEVKTLQRLLVSLGFVDGGGRTLEVDGSFGGATLEAFLSFQASRGLVPDGSCGPLSWNALLRG